MRLISELDVLQSIYPIFDESTCWVSEDLALRHGGQIRRLGREEELVEPLRRRGHPVGPREVRRRVEAAVVVAAAVPRRVADDSGLGQVDRGPLAERFPDSFDLLYRMAAYDLSQQQNVRNCYTSF